VLLNPIGGSIGLFTTTRLVYSSSNQVLNSHFYDIVFEKDSMGQSYRLGDIIAYSKNNAGNGINRRNFTLLGDPSMILAFPKHKVVTDSINHVSTASQTDTISALEYVTISGHIETASGEMFSSFNGTIYPVVYDKLKNLVTLANDGGNPMEFQARNTVLYKGKASVSNGSFNFSFYIPKDINYSVGTGKISYYSENGTVDAKKMTRTFGRRVSLRLRRRFIVGEARRRELRLRLLEELLVYRLVVSCSLLLLLSSSP